MVKSLVISDIHANIVALEAVLETADSGESFDACLCLGDLVGYGPAPNECIEAVRWLRSMTSVIGNHDVAALGLIDLELFNPQAKAAAEWTQAALSAESKAYLESLGQVEVVNGLTITHGSPRDPIWEYLDRIDQAPENFARFTTALCFVGHTHVPRIFDQDPESLRCDMRAPAESEVTTASGMRMIINPGSVGQPRDGDPRAAYALFDHATGEFYFHRVEYDVMATQAAMTEAGLPDSLAERLEFGF